MHPRTVQLQPHQPALGLRGVGGIHPRADADWSSLTTPPANRILTIRTDPKVKAVLKVRKRPLKIVERWLKTSALQNDPCFFLFQQEAQRAEQRQIPQQTAQGGELILPEDEYLGDQDRDQDAPLKPTIRVQT